MRAWEYSMKHTPTLWLWIWISIQKSLTCPWKVDWMNRVSYREEEEKHVKRKTCRETHLHLTNVVRCQICLPIWIYIQYRMYKVYKEMLKAKSTCIFSVILDEVSHNATVINSSTLRCTFLLIDHGFDFYFLPSYYS